MQPAKGRRVSPISPTRRCHDRPEEPVAGVARRGGRSARRRPHSRTGTADSPHLAFPDPTETIDLWPGIAPGAPARLPAETVRERSTDRSYNDRTVLGISRPRMALFRPERPNG